MTEVPIMDLRCKSMDWFLYDEDLRHSVPSRVQDSWCGVKGANIRIYEIYFDFKSVLFILNVEIYKKNPLLIIF